MIPVVTLTNIPQFILSIKRTFSYKLLESSFSGLESFISIFIRQIEPNKLDQISYSCFFNKMATIIEKVNKCWNSTTEIEKNDKVTIYRLEKPATLFGDISGASWIKDSNSNKLIIVKRSEYSSNRYEQS